MRTILEYLKVTFISVEFVILLIGTTIFFFWPAPALILSKKLTDSPTFLNYIALTPAGLAIWILKNSMNLYFPVEDQLKILQSWPDYWKWKIHILVGLAYSFLFSVIGVVVLAFSYKITEPDGIILIATSLTGQLVVFCFVFNARIRQSEILITK